MKIAPGLAICFSLLLIVMSTDVGGQQHLNLPQPLIVGTKESPPFSMKTADGHWTGLSIDLWREIAAELNLQYELPGYVWHITHRCHKREFLLKFDKDKKRWIHWLFETKKRYGLDILNFAVTSNHIHLLVYDGQVNIISDSIQLIAGRTARGLSGKTDTMQPP